MSTSDPHHPRRWQRFLPAYGSPAATPVADPAGTPTRVVRRRSGALGWVLALVVGAALALLITHSLEDPRSMGTQLDDAIGQLRATGSQAEQRITDSQQAVADASSNAVAGVGTAMNDAGISLKVKTALAADPALSASRIDVDTVNGIVRLQGPAPDATAKARATVLAGAPQGVRGVDNQLALPHGSQIVPPATGVQSAAQAVPGAAASAPPVSLDGPAAEDRAITTRVTTALGGDASLSRHKIIISTQQGVVRMEGVVSDAPSRDLATALASNQPGVKSVDNRLLTTEAATLLARDQQLP
ncbi:BON domain-containing protein [Roseateles sp. DC23W]|uniref:BON domain-containing protein n=1 Tax=Pelomonas dachongensis TaxID=3299029 RepID=A0ABW7EHZ9_9BURK